MKIMTRKLNSFKESPSFCFNNILFLIIEIFNFKNNEILSKEMFPTFKNNCVG